MSANSNDTNTITGFTNPVKAALAYFQMMGCGDIDEKSFNDVSEIVGDIISDSSGFTIDTLDDIRELCNIGKFEIWNKNGNISCSKI